MRLGLRVLRYGFEYLVDNWREHFNKDLQNYKLEKLQMKLSKIWYLTPKGLEDSPKFPNCQKVL